MRILIVNKYTFLKFNKSQFRTELKRIAFLFLSLIIITISYLYFTKPDYLFMIVLKNPKLWLGILAVYSILSVIPQEIIYRSFYFERYQKLFSNKNTLLLSNAAVFSLGHLFFQNPLVLAITFVGGFIFAYTYSKTKSLLLVTIEHIIYGCWLFTVGMGDMLGFPAG
jgi:membrane protease YdiL (CAAX protease family)